MLHWLLQSTADHPDLAGGRAPVGLLSTQEQVRFAALKTDKRRRDWLLGRWTAKHLIQSSIERLTGLRPSLDALIIGTDPDGAPHIQAGGWRLETGGWAPDLQSVIGNLQLSISHSGDRAFCALAEGRNAPIGADIEQIESRPWQFAEDYFTVSELLQVWRAPAERYDSLVTAIWSAKESALKALRLGLSVDTRSVSCSMTCPERSDEWADVAFAFDHRLLELDTAPALTGWWRAIDGFVLTVAAAAFREHALQNVSLSACDAIKEE